MIWTPTDELTLKRLYATTPIGELAHLLGRSRGAVIIQARILGFLPDRPPQTDIVVDGELCLIPLHSIKRPDLFAIVDSWNCNLINKYRWNLVTGIGRFYARTSIRKVSVSLHRFILNPPDGLDVDHKDGDGLNNREGNIRIATRSQNIANSVRGKVRGVQAKGQLFRAQIQGKLLGYFETEREAAIAFNEAALSCYGEFARLNDVSQLD